MAQRRMFSLKIVDTDLFLEMPASSRLLYYDLAMRADDDGFISNPKKILKVIGCSEDDFRLLCHKQFIIPFQSGVCVVKDWRVHNYIQKDRYQETHYKLEKNQLTTDDNGSYVSCIQDVYKMDTQVRLEIGKDSIEIGKDRDKIDSIESNKSDEISSSYNSNPKEKEKSSAKKEKERICFGEYLNIKLTQDEYDRLLKDFGKEVIEYFIREIDEKIQLKPKDYKYSDHNLAIRKWIRMAKEKCWHPFNKPIQQETQFKPMDEVFKDGKPI